MTNKDVVKAASEKLVSHNDWRIAYKRYSDGICSHKNLYKRASSFLKRTLPRNLGSVRIYSSINLAQQPSVEYDLRIFGQSVGTLAIKEIGKNCYKLFLKITKKHEYNNLKPSDIENKDRIIKSLFAKTGKQIIVEQNFWCDYGYNISVGENFYMNHNCIILDGAKVEFGDNVFIAPNCSFYTAGHPLDYETRNKGLEYAKPIKVGNNVWIGGNVVVLPGVTIGDNVVIGAGSIVTKDILSNVVAVGNPCRVVKEL